MEQTLNFNDGINVHPKNLINLAKQNKIPWEMLAIFLANLIPTQEKSKQIIRVLIQEVKNLHLELQNKKRSSDPLETEITVPKQNIVEGNDLSNKTFEENGFDDDKNFTKIEEASQNENEEHDSDNYEEENLLDEDDESDEILLKKDRQLKNDKRPYQCKTCHNYYDYFSNLKVHQRTHTGEKPFQCKTCGKRFAQFIVLRRHETTHTGDKPFKCKICNTFFTRRDSLTKHEKRHLRS